MIRKMLFGAVIALVVLWRSPWLAYERTSLYWTEDEWRQWRETDRGSTRGDAAADAPLQRQERRDKSARVAA